MQVAQPAFFYFLTIKERNTSVNYWSVGCAYLSGDKIRHCLSVQTSMDANLQ